MHMKLGAVEGVVFFFAFETSRCSVIVVRVKVLRIRVVFSLLCFIVCYGQWSGEFHGMKASVAGITGRTVILRGVPPSTFIFPLMSLFSGVHGAKWMFSQVR